MTVAEGIALGLIIAGGIAVIVLKLISKGGNEDGYDGCDAEDSGESRV